MERGVKRHLDKWVKGESVHNDERNECVPDFSCCNGGRGVSLEERRKFLEASESEREKMLVGFLAKALSNLGAEVVVK